MEVCTNTPYLFLIRDPFIVTWAATNYVWESEAAESSLAPQRVQLTHLCSRQSWKYLKDEHKKDRVSVSPWAGVHSSVNECELVCLLHNICQTQ